LEGENLVLPPLHRHWILLVRGMAPAIVVIGAFVLVLDVTLGGDLRGDVRLLGTAAAVVVLGVWMLLVWLRWAEDSLTVTDQRVLLEEGGLVRSSRVMPLHR